MSPTSPVLITPYRGRYLLTSNGEALLIVATFSQALAWAEVWPIRLNDDGEPETTAADLEVAMLYASKAAEAAAKWREDNGWPAYV